jgi:hypothetical protein
MSDASSSTPPSSAAAARVPEMMTDCPVCQEPLFDDEGVAPKKVAKILCYHLVHDECLRESAKALNADGQRYGIGGMGEPRGGCPICGQGVTIWFCFDQAAEFPVFWMKRIQTILQEMGPDGSPIPIEVLRDKLRADTGLTEAQKKYLDKKQCDMGRGFYGALEEEGKRKVGWKEVDGGPANGGYATTYFMEGAWKWNQEDDTLRINKGKKRNKTKKLHDNAKKTVRFNPMVTIHEATPTCHCWQWSVLVVILAIALSIYMDDGKDMKIHW